MATSKPRRQTSKASTPAKPAGDMNKRDTKFADTRKSGENSSHKGGASGTGGPGGTGGSIL
jgi:hypothetical protein